MTPVAVTLLYVPADRADRAAKALALGPDVVIVDLEDAVAPAAKPAAREALPSLLAGRGPSRVQVRVNALGTRTVALAAREMGALLVAISTDYVFDGEKGEPYHEFDEPRPASVYGKSKLAGEAEARLAPDHLIVRTAWVFGAGDDFVSEAIRRLTRGEEAGAITDLYGTPTHVGHLADRILPAALSGLRGLVHLGGPERMSRHELLARAKQIGDLPGELVEQKAGDLDRPAPRPADSSLTSLVLEGSGVPPMPPIDAAIEEILED